MKIAAINTVPIGSTGTIMKEIGELARKKGYLYKSFYGNWKKEKINDEQAFRFGYLLENKISTIFYRITGIQHIGSIFGTLQLISELKAYNPDVIHLHNIHLWVINIPILFKYIKKNNKKVVWTLHDCWSFTGHCTHYTMVKCEKWKQGCYDCPQYKEYPYSFIDQSKIMWKMKKKWFQGVNNMLIVTPSQWLSNQVGDSFLKGYPRKVIYNGIDLKVFNPVTLERNKIILLGVAFDWSIKKGVDIFNKLALLLSNNYQIIMVGTNDKVDKILDKKIISIHRTKDRKELVKLYSYANIFINPTREDTFPTVNIEALACGTPVITFNTGGSPESIDNSCGVVIENNDIESLIEVINGIKTTSFTKEDCLNRAKKFNKDERYAEYIELYERITQW